MSTVQPPIPSQELVAHAPSRVRVQQLARDYSELIKLRVTSLIVLSAWAGAYFAAPRSGLPELSWAILHACIGISLIAAGSAALNEVFEKDVDALMRRTAHRPLPSNRMSMVHAAMVSGILVFGGALYLALFCNLLTGCLALATAIVYLAAYTPLKRVSPVCTFVGAFPGAMPPLLGWTAIRGRIDVEGLILFAIVFFWQFPHFYSIAWLYREDYQRANIRMLPVVEVTGKATSREIVLYSIALLPVSIAPTLLHMSGWIYLTGAILFGSVLLWYGVRLATFKQPLTSGHSKRRARQLLLATVFYLPLLFALMMLNAR
ncbi:MAG TPA: heme o synthase [Terriglobales bacterium]|nr:heme o synthase [Terriglobales bacterium]